MSFDDFQVFEIVECVTAKSPAPDNSWR
jgi:hypothetical protein